MSFQAPGRERAEGGGTSSKSPGTRQDCRVHRTGAGRPPPSLGGAAPFFGGCPLLPGPTLLPRGSSSHPRAPGLTQQRARLPPGAWVARGLNSFLASPALGGCGPDTCRREVSTSARAAGQVHYGTALLGRPAAARPHGRLRKSCPPRRCQNDPPRPPESSCCCRQEAPLEGPGVPKDPVLRGYPHSEGKRWVAILRVGRA